MTPSIPHTLNEPDVRNPQSQAEGQNHAIQTNSQLEADRSNDSSEIVEINIAALQPSPPDPKELSNFEVIPQSLNPKLHEPSTNTPQESTPFPENIPPNLQAPELQKAFKQESASPWETLGKKHESPEKPKMRTKKLKFAQRKLKKKLIPRKPIKSTDMDLFKDLDQITQKPPQTGFPSRFNPLHGDDDEILPDVEFTVGAPPAPKPSLAKSPAKPSQSTWKALPKPETPEKSEYVIGKSSSRGAHDARSNRPRHFSGQIAH